MKHIINKVSLVHHRFCVNFHFFFILSIILYVEMIIVVLSKEKYSISTLLIILPASIIVVPSLFALICTFSFFDSSLEMT